MLSKRLKSVLFTSFLLLLFIVASILLLSHLIKKPSVQNHLLNYLSDALGYEVSVGEIELSLWHGIGVGAKNFTARSRTGTETIIATEVRVGLDVGELIKGRVLPTKIFLFQPKIELTIGQDNQSSKPGQASSYKEILGRRLTLLPSISLHEARIVIKNIPCVLEDLYFNMSQNNENPQAFDINLQGIAGFANNNIPLTLHGTLTQSKEPQNKLFADLVLKCHEIPLAQIPWAGPLPVKRGFAELDMNLGGFLDGPLSMAGRIIAEDLDFALVRRGRKKDFSLSRLTLDFDSFYSEKVLQISSLDLKTSECSLVADSKIDFRDTDDPHLSLRVTSQFMPLKTFKRIFPTPLLPEWVETSLVPSLARGDVRVSLFSLDGTLKQFRDLRRAENAGSLSMQLVWKDLEILQEESVLPFKNVSGELHIQNGWLHLSNVKASFGQSTIKNGTLGIRNIFAGAGTYDITVDGLFDLQELLGQKEMGFIPLDFRRRIPEAESVSGMLTADVSIRYKSGWEHPRIQKGSFRFRECKVNHEALVFSLAVEEAEVKVDAKEKNEFRGRGIWGNSTFEASGSFENSLKTVNADIVGHADVNQIIGHFHHSHQATISFSDLAPCRVSISRLNNTWSLEGEIDPQGFTLDATSFSIHPIWQGSKISFDAVLQPQQKWHLKEFRYALGKSSLELSGSYDLKDKDSLYLNVVTPGLLLEDLGIRLKSSEIAPKGFIRCQTKMRTSYRDPSRTFLTGQMVGQNVSIDLSVLPSPMTGCDFMLQFAEKEISVNFLKMQIGQNPIEIQGKVKGWDGLKGEMMINVQYLDPSGFKIKGADSRSEGKWLGRFLNQSDIHFKIKVLQGRWQNIKYGPLDADCVLRSSDFFVEHSQIHLQHGIVNLKGHVKKGDPPELFFSSYIKMTDQPVEALQGLLQTIGIEEEYVGGHLTVEALLFTRGKKKEDLITSLTGSANVLLANGKIAKSNVIFKILDFLSLQKIFMQKPPDLSKEGFYFESIEGHIEINNGTLETRNLTMKSPVFNAVAQGKVNLHNRQVDADLGVQPLGTVDSLVSKIPIAGYILTGEKKSLLIYYFKVQGALSKPEVSYIPFKKLGLSLIDFFKRAFLTPKRLFEKIPRSYEDLTKQDEPSPLWGP